MTEFFLLLNDFFHFRYSFNTKDALVYLIQSLNLEKLQKLHENSAISFLSSLAEIIFILTEHTCGSSSRRMESFHPLINVIKGFVALYIKSDQYGGKDNSEKEHKVCEDV